MPLINCEINVILTWSNTCFIIDNPIAGQETTITLCSSRNFIKSR